MSTRTPRPEKWKHFQEPDSWPQLNPTNPQYTQSEDWLKESPINKRKMSVWGGLSSAKCLDTFIFYLIQFCLLHRSFFLSEQTKALRGLTCVPRETANLQIQTEASATFTVLRVFNLPYPNTPCLAIYYLKGFITEKCLYHGKKLLFCFVLWPTQARRMA